jgi:ornithine cyclodeaminase/alanine dehydrogenase-like protein (mu-crystallin family)
VLASETLGRADAGATSVVGAGVNGRAVARTFLARGRSVQLADARREQAQLVAEELGAGVVDTAAALAADVVVTVTPGAEILFGPGSLRPGQHVSLMGADGPGKAEIAVEELLRVNVVCDEWEQASHNGDIARAAADGRLTRADVAELGRVLLGQEEGRTGDDDITVFDSTGLAVQDLAVALAVYERYRANPDRQEFVGITTVEVE